MDFTSVHCFNEIALTIACSLHVPVAHDFYAIDQPTRFVQEIQTYGEKYEESMLLSYYVQLPDTTILAKPILKKVPVPIPLPKAQQEVAQATQKKVPEREPIVLASFAAAAPAKGLGALFRRKDSSNPSFLKVSLGDGSEDLHCFYQSPRLKSIVAKMNKKYGKTVVIESGYRSPAYNRSKNGAKHSMHMQCSGGNGAVDVYVPGVASLELCRFAKSLPETGGYGIYNSGFIHVDTGRRRSWDWRSTRTRRAGNC